MGVLALAGLLLLPQAPALQIESKILGENKTLFVSKPTGYESGRERYPVLYVLDGQQLFDIASSSARFLASTDRIPDFLVVGIDSGTNAQRTRDLTPPSTNEIDNRFSPGGGGADRFLAFLGKELIPYIDGNYRTRPYRLLAGHSFGGLFALHGLIHRPGLFQAFLVMDPSVGWNGGAVVAELSSLLSAKQVPEADLFISASADAGVQKLVSVLQEKAPPVLRWKAGTAGGSDPCVHPAAEFRSRAGCPLRSLAPDKSVFGV